MANDTTPKINLAGDPYSTRAGRARIYENIDTSKTLAAIDSGTVQNVIADSQVITLPATVVGLTFTIRNGGAPTANAPIGTGADGTVLVSIAPNAADNIAGGSFTAVDNKALNNTKVTANVGDEVTLVGDGVNGWFIKNIIGTWAKTP